MNICRHCKINEGTICDSKSKSANGNLHLYYSCRPCHAKRMRNYRLTTRGKEVWRNIRRRQYAKHTNKVLAREKLTYAVRTGKIIKPKCCSMCFDKTKVQAHHEDYAKPLDVKWLCIKCHTNTK